MIDRFYRDRNSIPLAQRFIVTNNIGVFLQDNYRSFDRNRFLKVKLDKIMDRKKEFLVQEKEVFSRVEL